MRLLSPSDRGAFFFKYCAGGAGHLEHIAGIDDFEVAEATYWAAVVRWPMARITLRQGARVVMMTWTE